MKLAGRKPADTATCSGCLQHFQMFATTPGGEFRGYRAAAPSEATASRRPILVVRSEPAPIRWYTVVAMQFGLLRAIAPVEILVGVERRRPPQFVILDVELIGLEFRVVAQTRPWQRQQAGSHAEKSAEAEDGIAYLAGDL